MKVLYVEKGSKAFNTIDLDINHAFTMRQYLRMFSVPIKIEHYLNHEE